MRWSKKHSTSYFPGTGKRHGLVVVVVSGMALGGIRGGERGRLYSLDIHLTTQKYFQLFSGSWKENSPGAADALWGESPAADVTGLVSELMDFHRQDQNTLW